MKRRYTIDYSGQRYTVDVTREREAIAVEYAGQCYLAYLQEETAPRSVNRNRTSGSAPTPLAVPPSSAADASSAGVVQAPMAGVVKEVRTQVGASIAPGDILLIMEAMKMEIEVAAGQAGTVREILVQIGATVDHHQALLRFERMP